MMYLRYLWYVLRHKWFVFVECCKLGIPWRGITHDLSKFRPREWFPYARRFYGTHGNREAIEGAFDVAWLHHQKRNDHHWQYWLLTPDRPRSIYGLGSHDDGMSHLIIFLKNTGVELCFMDTVENEQYKRCRQMYRDLVNTPAPLPMPSKCRREMLADWRGAGRALGKPDTKAWYLKNCEDIALHPETRAWVEDQLGICEETP